MDECGYLEHIDGDGDDDIKQVPQCQAANQDVGSVPHTLVLVYDPEQRGVADDPHHEDQTRHDGVHVLEGVLDLCGLYAHGGEGAPWSGWLQGRERDGGVVLGGFRNFGAALGVSDEPRGSDPNNQQETQQSDGPHPNTSSTQRHRAV